MTDRSQGKDALICEPDPLARIGVHALLTRLGWTVTHDAASPEDLAHLKADLLICDASVFSDALTGFEGKTLALVRSEAQLRAVLAVGADAVLSRSSAPECLGDALNRLANGKPYYSSDLVAHLDRPKGPEAALSKQERRVVELLKTGVSNEGIAKVLGIKPQTVRNYSVSIYRKLNVAGRAEAILKLNGLA